MFQRMEKNADRVYMRSDEGLKKVKESRYAYFMEDAQIKYFTERNCSLRQVGRLLDSKGYAIALPKGQRITGFRGAIRRSIDSPFFPNGVSRIVWPFDYYPNFKRRFAT